MYGWGCGSELPVGSKSYRLSEMMDFSQSQIKGLPKTSSRLTIGMFRALVYILYNFAPAIVSPPLLYSSEDS